MGKINSLQRPTRWLGWKGHCVHSECHILLRDPSLILPGEGGGRHLGGGTKILQTQRAGDEK